MITYPCRRYLLVAQKPSIVIEFEHWCSHWNGGCAHTPQHTNVSTVLWPFACAYFKLISELQVEFWWWKLVFNFSFWKDYDFKNISFRSVSKTCEQLNRIIQCLLMCVFVPTENIPEPIYFEIYIYIKISCNITYLKSICSEIIWNMSGQYPV